MLWLRFHIFSLLLQFFYSNAQYFAVLMETLLDQWKWNELLFLLRICCKPVNWISTPVQSTREHSQHKTKLNKLNFVVYHNRFWVWSCCCCCCCSIRYFFSFVFVSFFPFIYCFHGFTIHTPFIPLQYSVNVFAIDSLCVCERVDLLRFWIFVICIWGLSQIFRLFNSFSFILTLKFSGGFFLVHSRASSLYFVCWPVYEFICS